MSIVIKGMEMPETSLQCEFCESGYCNKMNMRFCPGAVKRPDWCPLVELPDKHGRLVDDDIIYQEMINYYHAEENKDKHTVDYANGFCECLHIVDNIPTVIEAEGGN